MSIRHRITLVTAVFLGIVIVAVSVYTLRVQQAHLRAESERKVGLALSMLSEMATPPLLQGDLLTLAGIADRAALGQPERVCIADRRGAIVADSEHQLYGEKNSVIEIVRRDHGRFIERSGKLWRGAAAIKDYRGYVVGIVYVTFSTRPMDAGVMQVAWTVVAFTIIAVVLAVLVSYGLGRYLSSSMTPLLVAIRKTTTGDFNCRINPTGTLELDEMGRAFNRMARLVGRQVHDSSVLNQLTTRLMTAKSLEEFAVIIKDTCRTLVEGDAVLLAGDPRSGSLEMVGDDRPVRRLTANSAAFLASNERRAVMVGADSIFQPGYEVVTGVKLYSGVVTPLITPESETVGVLFVKFDPVERPTPDRQDESTVLAAANMIAPILAAYTHSKMHGKAIEALREILRPEVVPQPEGLDVYAFYQPAEATSGLGGDCYDVISLGEDRWGLAIGDVSGKGLDAGRYTAMAKYVVRSFALGCSSPARTISQVSNALATQMKEQRFVTMFYSTLDMKSKKLTYCCAGHPSGLLYSPSTDMFRELNTGDGVIGSDNMTIFHEDNVQLHEGDLLLMCTDGIVEARNIQDDYGVDRIKKIMRDNCKRSLKNIARAVVDDVTLFTHNMVRDDMAILLVRVSSLQTAMMSGSDELPGLEEAV